MNEEQPLADIKQRIESLRSSIKHESAALPYADGQAYYKSKRNIEAMERELRSLENYKQEA